MLLVGRARHRQVAARSRRCASSSPTSRTSGSRYYCSPYHTQQRAAIRSSRSSSGPPGFERDDSAEAKLDKLEALLGRAPSEPERGGAAVAALLVDPDRRALPAADLTPQRQKAAHLRGPARPAGGARRRRPGAVLLRGRALDRPDHARAVRPAGRAHRSACRSCSSSPSGPSSRRPGLGHAHVTHALAQPAGPRARQPRSSTAMTGGKALPARGARPDPRQDRRRAAVRRGADQGRARVGLLRRRRRPLRALPARCRRWRSRRRSRTR